MIICTQCGKKNDDENRFCKTCGKKLQSTRKPVVAANSSSRPLDKFEHKGMPPEAFSSLRRMLEAWVYVLILAITTVACFYHELWWPLYPVVILLAFFAWRRKL